MKCLYLLPALLALPFYATLQTTPSPSAPSLSHQSLLSWSQFVEESEDSSEFQARSELIYRRWENVWQGRMTLDAATGWDAGPLLDAYQSVSSQETSDWEWEYAGPHNQIEQNNGRVECAATPTGEDFLTELLLGSPTGGIWRSSNAGESWHCVSDDDFSLPGLGCYWLTYHPQDPSVVFASITLATAAEVSQTGKELGYGLGIFRSNDGGETWVPTPFSFNPEQRQLTTKIIANPLNGDQMYAAVNDKVYYTDDAWMTSTPVFDQLNHSYIYRDKVIADIETQPGDFGTLWVSSTGVESWTWLEAPIAPGEYHFHAAELWKGLNVDTG